MNTIEFLRPPSKSTIPFLTLFSFLLWFVIGRIFTYYFPSFYLTVDDNHVHHFAYGIIMLSILSYTFLACPLSRSSRLRGAILLGIALAWAYDEFAMWLTLENIYYDRRNYDAILTISLILLNLIYLPSFWAKWGKRLGKLINILLLGLPKKILNIK
ncbi:hypothetical protein KKE34_00555 [Patescibacteria group bacterium]|nr:hypothetical protein [Patescibacteria group bacterium]MBU1885083.1 hypothetical protein [Patescibacteria group bacterium]